MQIHTTSPKFVGAFVALLTTLLLARTASADTMTLMWDPNPEPEVIGYIVHVGTQPGSYTQNIDVGEVVTWVFPGAVAGQRYCFTVSAYVTGPLEGAKSSEVCGYSNTAPVLSNPGNQTSTVGQSATLQLSGSDPDSTPITYSASGLPSGLTLMTSTGYISGTPTTAGSYPVTARVTDGVLTSAQTFTWSVQAPDTTAPVVTMTSPTSAATYTTTASTLSLGGTASDNVSVQQVTWVNSRGGAGAATGTSAWSVTGIALQPGTNAVTVTARDAAGNTANRVITVTLNVPPTLNAVANQTSFTGLSTTLQLVGADVNADPLTYTASGIPPGLAIAVSSGLISGAPTMVGTYNVTVSVSDGAQSASRTFTWTIQSGSPVVAVTSPSVRETTASTVDLSGTCLDNTGCSGVAIANTLTGESGTAAALAGTSWSKIGHQLNPGINHVKVTGTDGALTSEATISILRELCGTTLPYNTSFSLHGTGTAWSTLGPCWTTYGSGLPPSIVANRATASAMSFDCTVFAGQSVPQDQYIELVPVTVSPMNQQLRLGLRVTGTPGTNADLNGVWFQVDGSNSGSNMIARYVNGALDQVIAFLPGVSFVPGVTPIKFEVTGNIATALVDGVPVWSGDISSFPTGRPAVCPVGVGTQWDSVQVGSTGVPVDSNAPTVTITDPGAPTFATSTAALSLSGTASDNVGVADVSWANSRGGSGAAAGTSSWSATVTLQSGDNIVTVAARDAAGNTSTDVITVTYTAPDTTAPAVTITAPTTAATFVTSAGSLTLSGTSSDASGVVEVTWANDRGGSGSAQGTANWSVVVALHLGVNVLTVTARDAAGNMSTEVLTVTYAVASMQVSITANRPAPQPAGTTVTFTAAADGGAAPYQFRWLVFSKNSWKVSQGWSSSNTFSWRPVKRDAGYRVRVEARSATGEIVTAMLPFGIN